MKYRLIYDSEEGWVDFGKRWDIFADAETTRIKHWTDTAVVVVELPLEIEPRHREALERYRDHRIHPGGFLAAVLSDLEVSYCMSAGDPEAQLNLPAVVKWIEQNLPGESYGTREAFKAWISKIPGSRG